MVRTSATRFAVVLATVTSVGIGRGASQAISIGVGEVWSVAFSPDGRMLAVAGAEGMVGVFDAETHELLRRLEGHTGLVRGVAFSPDGSRLATAGFDHTLRVFDAQSGATLKVLQDSAPAFYPSFLPGADQLVSASEEPGVRVWDLARGELLRTLGGHADRAWAAATSPDGTQIASGSRDGTARLWDARTGELRHELSHHTAAVCCAAFSPDGVLLATGSADTSVRLWDTRTGEPTLTLGGHSGPVCDLGFSPDGRIVASVTGDGIVRLWGAATGYFLRALRGGGYALAFSPDGALMATGGAKDTVDILDVRHAISARESVVDLVPEMTRIGFVPRGQGARNTCSVFTTMGVLEYAAYQRTGDARKLSVDYLNWACNQVIGNQTEDRGQFFKDLLQGFEQYGICREDEMPYRPAFEPDYAPADEARKTAEGIRSLGLTVHWVNPLGKGCITREQLDEIRGVLASGYPVAAGSYHSVLLVGYIDDPAEPGGGSFLIRDSGGPGHYFEMSYEEALGRVGDVFWVE